MKSKTKLAIVISLLIIISTTCQKEDIPSCSYPENAKLKRVVVCGYIESECPTKECDDIVSIYEEFEYDSQSRIKKVMWHARNEKHLYLYNSKDQLEKIEYYNSFEDEYLLYKTVTYTYSDDGKKIRENIEFDEIGNQYKLFKYTNNSLTKIEYYEINSDEIEYYILLEYDNSENLIKETTYTKDGGPFSYVEHIFENGLNVRSYENGNEFIKTYDENDNLVFLESNYQSGSSKTNFKHKYEYYY